jgi:hypothetical protein
MTYDGEVIDLFIDGSTVPHRLVIDTIGVKVGNRYIIGDDWSDGDLLIRDNPVSMGGKGMPPAADGIASQAVNLTGQIDEVRIFGATLNADEARAVYRCDTADPIHGASRYILASAGNDLYSSRSNSG